MNITKALSDENRVRILMALNAEEELCVCHLNNLLELAPSTVSKHLFLLKNAGLVKVRKEGRWMHYRLNRDPNVPDMVTEVLDWIIRSVSKDSVVLADRDRVEDIISVQPQNGCSR